MKGRRLDTDSGIRTRAKAREQAEQWHMIPAPARILALMADTLLEAREGAPPPAKTLGFLGGRRQQCVWCVLVLMANMLLEMREGAVPLF